ncbi:unnamed protein product, partial [Effrenium voratum]
MPGPSHVWFSASIKSNTTPVTYISAPPGREQHTRRALPASNGALQQRHRPVLPMSPRSASPRSPESPRPVQSPRPMSPGSVCSSQESHGAQDAARQKVVQRVARYMSAMQVSDPELLRAASPSCVLSGFGRALRDGPFEAHHLSRATTRISAFWSHSWHGQPWKKILVLLFIYNGFPAVVLGSWAALLLLALTSWNFLPGYAKAATLEPGTVYIFSMWGLGGGALVAGLALLLWQPRGSIFLDRVCIHQTDENLKAQAILSIGAFLKNSDTMLVLWDPSYVERLWCVFELAAFLQSQEQSVNRLAIRPTFMGPIALAGCISLVLINAQQIFVPFADRMTGNLVYWLVCMVLFTLAGQVLRSYYRSVETMKRQLAKFRFEETKSHCCTVRHIDVISGQPLLCDRQIIRDCVCRWFGSVESFESCVQTKVPAALGQRLGRFALPLHWALGISITNLWCGCELIAARLREGELYFALVVGIHALSWSMFVPIFSLVCASALANKLRRRRRWLWLDVLITMMGASILCLLGLGLVTCQY